MSYSQKYLSVTQDLSKIYDQNFQATLLPSCILIFPYVSVCWVPFFCVNIVAAFCKTCIGGQTFKILSWLGKLFIQIENFNSIRLQIIQIYTVYLIFFLFQFTGYSNSAFNPIIYSIFNTEFREAFKRILTTKAAFCCTDDLNLHCRNSERFVTDYQSAKIHSARSSADLEQISAIQYNFESLNVMAI